MASRPLCSCTIIASNSAVVSTLDASVYSSWTYQFYSMALFGEQMRYLRRFVLYSGYSLVLRIPLYDHQRTFLCLLPRSPSTTCPSRNHVLKPRSARTLKAARVNTSAHKEGYSTSSRVTRSRPCTYSFSLMPLAILVPLYSAVSETCLLITSLLHRERIDHRF
jgi:hypothetical protein